MQSNKIDILNIVLIAISFFLAIKLPVELFLFSYAVLGPLHYLTEIGWLEKRNYFTKERKDIWVLFALTGIITFAFIFSQADVIDPNGVWTQTDWYNDINNFASEATGGILFFAFITALAYAIFNKKQTRYIVITIAFILALFIHLIEPIWIIFGIYLPTIIHVSIFTGLFMLYGALKNKSKWGYISTLIFFIAVLSFFYIDFEPNLYQFDPANSQRLLDSTFIHVGAILSESLGLHDSSDRYNLISPLGIKIQALFAFCYTYHYLNWFSKTKIINWHAVSNKWLYFTAVIWLMSMALYFINYKVGFIALFFLSFLHVILEFPLNHVTIKEIWKQLRSMPYFNWSKKTI